MSSDVVEDKLKAFESIRLPLRKMSDELGVLRELCLKTLELDDREKRVKGEAFLIRINDKLELANKSIASIQEKMKSF